MVHFVFLLLCVFGSRCFCVFAFKISKLRVLSYGVVRGTSWGGADPLSIGL
ncbi:hypothetical protein HanIR_Chr09g0428981 [Helianthus annuus]|nr:hypothetical protein HanIR_Chr09g0428981 [Helianthus annuus]